MDQNSFSAPVTLREVAERVGVTQSTASAVLNGTRSGTRVSEKTRIALTEAAAEMGYRPNELARSLTNRKTRQIGFFSHFQYLSAGNGFLSELVGGIQEATSASQNDLVLRSVPHESSSQRIVDSLADRRVDGIVCLAPQDPTLMLQLSQAGVPVVAVVDQSPFVPSITVDDVEGGRLLAHHLAERGVRTVIYRDWYAPPTSGQNRRIGFEAAALDLGLEVIEGRRLHEQDLGEPLPEEIDVINRHDRVAIACWSDDGAYATCNALAALGYEIPGQVLVTGYNGVPLHFPPKWDITTIEAPWRRVGEVAVEALLARIAGNTALPHLTLPVTLRVGGTT